MAAVINCQSSSPTSASIGGRRQRRRGGAAARRGGGGSAAYARACDARFARSVRQRPRHASVYFGNIFLSLSKAPAVRRSALLSSFFFFSFFVQLPARTPASVACLRFYCKKVFALSVLVLFLVSLFLEYFRRLCAPLLLCGALSLSLSLSLSLL